MQQGRIRRLRRVALAGAGLVGALALVQACRHRGGSAEAPRRATANAVAPQISSTIAVPVSTDLAALQAMLDREIPHELWTIEKDGVTCAKPQRMNLFGAKIPYTPKLTCRIEGSARRGPIVLHGEGDVIRADLPILASVHVRTAGGLVGTTATGTAMAHARIRLSVSRNWQPSGTIRLDYDWKEPPGITLAGQRITFTDKADEKLRPVLAKLERDLPGELGKLRLRDRIEGLWAQGFTVLKLNDRNPPVWMRVVPQRLGYSGYEITGNRLVLKLSLVALTQAVVGQRPAAEDPTPLPPRSDEPLPTGAVKVFAPVLAAYDELEPVIAKALDKRSAKPFDLPGIGAVRARFTDIEAYGAEGGRVAVGANVTAEPVSGTVAPVHGRIWFAAVPHNAQGSQVIRFTDLQVSGHTDGTGTDLALALANSAGFSETIADALRQNVSGDYEKLMVKIRRAIGDLQRGDFRVNATLDRAINGTIQPFANGLYMPVWLEGRAKVTYAPK